MKNVTIVTTTYKTFDMTKESIDSLRKFYPTIKIIIINNTGKNFHTTFLKKYASKDPNIQLINLLENIGHGAGLDLGIRLAKTKYVFTLDSDTIIKKGGFLELMSALLYNGYYGIGCLGWYTYDTGHVVKNPEQYHKKVMRILWTFASLINTKNYLKYHSFDSDNGINASPLKLTMRDLKDSGREQLLEFNIKKYIHHIYGGTRKKHGIPKTE